MKGLDCYSAGSSPRLLDFAHPRELSLHLRGTEYKRQAVFPFRDVGPHGLRSRRTTLFSSLHTRFLSVDLVKPLYPHRNGL